MNKNRKAADKRFYAILAVFFSLFAFITFFPFWNVLVVSLNDPVDSMKGELYFWPRVFSTISYQSILYDNGMLMQGLQNSVLRTLIGTVLNVFCSSLIAFALSRKDFMLRGFLSKYVVLTMYISAGLIPNYMLYKQLGLLNKFTVYIIPQLLSAYNIIILRTYMQNIPSALSEAAVVDGAKDADVLFRIIFPICKPVLATVALFIAVFQWSEWKDTFFYASNVNNNGLTTLQYEMMKIINSANASLSDSQIADLQGGIGSKPTPESLRAAITIIATVPILVVYPFLQRYFVNGVTLGALKE